MNGCRFVVFLLTLEYNGFIVPRFLFRIVGNSLKNSNNIYIKPEN